MIKGIEFRLEKATTQIQAILIKPTLKLTPDIFYLNLTKYCMQALQIADNIISHYHSEKHVPTLFQKLCMKLKQAKKCKPEPEDEDEEAYRPREKDQITEFLNSRKPIKDNKNLAELNWYVEHMEKKEKDTQIFVQCMTKMKKNDISKKVKTDSRQTQTNINWVGDLQITQSPQCLLSPQSLFDSIPMFRQLMDERENQLKKFEEQYNDMQKKYQQMKQLEQDKINEIESQSQIKLKLSPNAHSKSKKKKMSISGSKKNLPSKEHKNGDRRDNLSGFCTPNLSGGDSVAASSPRVQDGIADQSQVDKCFDRLSELQRLDLIKEKSSRKSRQMQQTNLDRKSGQYTQIYNQVQQTSSQFPNLTTDGKSIKNKTQIDLKSIGEKLREGAIPTKISQENSEYDSQSPSQHRKQNISVHLAQNQKSRVVHLNHTQENTSRLLKPASGNKPIKKSSFTHRDQAKFNNLVNSSPFSNQSQLKNVKQNAKFEPDTTKLGKVHTVHRESEIPVRVSQQFQKSKQKEKAREANKENKRQREKFRQKKPEFSSYHEQKLKIASVTTNNRFQYARSKYPNGSPKESFQNLPYIHKMGKMITHQSESDEPYQKQKQRQRERQRQRQRQRQNMLIEHDQQFLDYVNTFNSADPRMKYQQSLLEQKDTIIYNKITELQSSPKENHARIQQYLSMVEKMHRKLCGKECKHLLRFYKQVNRNNWGNRIAIQLPTRKFGFFS